METSFTPIASLLGGGILGLGVLLMMFSNGRIVGMGGMTSQLVPPNTLAKGNLVPVAFIAGVLLAPMAYLAATGSFPAQWVPENMTYLIASGLLVGFGVVIGNGCTSGHGVCGISRLSGRSTFATVVFMGTAALTVYVARHILGGL